MNINALAEHYLTTKRGIGMSPPFYAETANTKGDENWPLWIVRNIHCNSLGYFMPRSIAESLAESMNRIALVEQKDRTNG